MKKYSLLREMLRHRRPDRSETEETFIERFIDPLPGVYADAYGNRLRVYPEAKTIVCCHTDTVHRNGGLQQVRMDPATGFFELAERERVSNCLGADDTAGVYACVRLIEADAPVTVIFHRGEELGGKGSAWLAKHYSEWLKTFNHCLSLDRRGWRDIVTHQRCERTASDSFAQALADQLDMGHEPAEGLFTDSANYADLIPECSNISVGYNCEHSTLEMLDADYLETLIGRLLGVDWDSLPSVRDPFVYERTDWTAWCLNESSTAEVELEYDWSTIAGRYAKYNI